MGNMKLVYFFDEGDGKNKKLLGGKGAGLAEMTQLDLPVPPGFIITTEVCNGYYAKDRQLPKNLMSEVKKNLKKIETKTGKKFGCKNNPLLISVRSGSAVSMPGMMDTILNLGLNDKTVYGLANTSKNPRFAWDSYRRFVHMFGKIVFEIEDSRFDDILEKAQQEYRVQQDIELGEDALQKLVGNYKEICSRQSGREFPNDPYEQLELAIEAVFKSWMGERAVVYRDRYKITKDIANGTAVSVVAMVFGNMGTGSATGVVFTRDPADGSKKLFGEYLLNAQGEDVVAGIRTPRPIDQLANDMPSVDKQLKSVCEKLENHYKEPQDIEFTVERGKFYLLQTRGAKMNAASMVRTSVDMVREKLITKESAILRLRLEDLDQLLHKTIDKEAEKQFRPIAQGIPASPGAATGIIVFDVKKALEMGEKGTKVILVRKETRPEDVPAFFASVGILTSRGGKTSHAAVVARGMGKACVVGCSDIKIDHTAKQFFVGDNAVHEGEYITIEGSTGKVYQGELPTVEPQITDDFRTILKWAEDFKILGVRANADDPEAAILARSYGAKGIGLCRTERMFNAADRLPVFIRMILAQTDDERQEALVKLLPLQKQDFKEILMVMEGYDVTIRLLDPPLHEFLPNIEQLLYKIHNLEKKASSSEELAKAKQLLERVRELSEVNPMMGLRGVRVGITLPEIYKMQIKAVCEATAELIQENINIHPQIMVPQVGSLSELNYVKTIYDKVKAEVESSHGVKLNINFGTMMEVVRACLTAGELAETAEFFSFGTNDLTQAVFSFSREDAESKFIPEYLEKEIMQENPFQSLDINGVGSLIEISIKKGRSVNPKLEIGICGEHGGDPASVRFCHKRGLTYVSTSPHRIPLAILAAAQASLEKDLRS